MLPTNAIQTTRLNAEDLPHAVPPATRVLDVLSEFVPGQKLMAQIQFQLANGAYRATIAQRDVTLALPFSAKTGDALELEVVNTNGRIAFAIAPQEAAVAKEQTSANASISRTGLLISSLLGSNEDTEESPGSVELAKGAPLSDKPPAKGGDLAPLLERAVVRSGLFYESHQAKWVSSSLPAEALLDEPQAQLSASSPAAPALTGKPATPGGLPSDAAPPQATHPTAPRNPAAAAVVVEDKRGGSLNVSLQTPGSAPGSAEAAATTAQRAIPEEIAPIVQQQLTSLANSVYAFHGLAWPGQRIEWEIVDEDGRQGGASDDDTPSPWNTRLRLSLPSLGAIDASLQLSGSELNIRLIAPKSETLEALRNAAPQLLQRLADAGLRLSALQVAQQPDANVEPPAA